MICRDCPRREPGCHGKCLDYAAYVETLSQRGRKAEQDYATYLAETKKRMERLYKSVTSK